MLNQIIKIIIKVFKIPSEPKKESAKCKIFHADPAFLYYKILNFLFAKLFRFLSGPFIFIIIILGTFNGKPISNAHIGFLAIILGFILLSSLISLIFAVLLINIDYRMRWYLIDDTTLRIREGALNIKEMTITFANVQNFYITQGPLQKFFGIADIKIETAGGKVRRNSFLANYQKQEQELSTKFHDASIKGVRNYEEIKNIVMKTLKKYKNTGLGQENKKYTISTKNNPRKIELLREIRNEFTTFAKFAETSLSSNEINEN